MSAPLPVPIPAEEASNPLRWLFILAAMIGAVLEVLDTSVTNVAIPQMQGNLGAALSQIGWVNTSYIIRDVIVLPITGWRTAAGGGATLPPRSPLSRWPRCT